MSGAPPSCASWWEALRADPLDWLLDASQPNLLWRVLVELVGRPPDSVAVGRARGGANAVDPVASLLEPFLPGRAPALESPGAARERVLGAVFLGADPDDPRLQSAAESLLDGDFDTRPPCAVARDLQALAGLRWGADLRFQERLAWLDEAAPRGRSGGWLCPLPEHRDRGGECRVTAVAVLATATDLDDGRRASVAGRAAAGIRRALDTADLVLRAAHPNLDRTDALEQLWTLARARVPFDPVMAPALEALQAAQDVRGRWQAAAVGEGDRIPGTEPPGRPSGWLTLHALVALRAYAVPAALPRLFPVRPVDG